MAKRKKKGPFDDSKIYAETRYGFYVKVKAAALEKGLSVKDYVIGLIEKDLGIVEADFHEKPTPKK